MPGERAMVEHDGDEIGARFRELECQAFPLGICTTTRWKYPASPMSKAKYRSCTSNHSYK